MAATPDVLADRLQGVRETTSLLYNRMMENMGYGQQERLKDIVEKEAEEDEQPAAPRRKRGRDQQQRNNNNRIMMMSDMIRLQK